jgi:hypothetical protein
MHDTSATKVDSGIAKGRQTRSGAIDGGKAVLAN